jgi:hypothetical protein
LFKGAEPRTVDPLRNSTLPVGVPVVEDVIVAVKVTDALRLAFTVDDVMAVALAACVTVRAPFSTTNV